MKHVLQCSEQGGQNAPECQWIKNVTGGQIDPETDNQGGVRLLRNKKISINKGGSDCSGTGGSN
jgi:hypothetical protein